MEYLQKVINKEINSNILLGASVGIWKDGNKIFREDFGFMDLDRKNDMRSDGIYRLYSSTKPITATAAMILFERGIIDLYDSVSKYLDGFKSQNVYVDGKIVPANRPVTIIDLLNMTSGLVYPGTDLSGIDMKNVFENGISAALSGNGLSTVEFCNQIGSVPLAYQPGELWRYGTSADILGAVIEVASGKRFSNFLKDEIFAPLDMLDTDFYVPENKRDRLVQMCNFVPSENKLEEYKGNHLLILLGKEKPTFESGGAGLFSTIEDYSHFANMLLCGGVWNGKRILGKKTVEFMRSNQLTPKQMSGLWDTLNGYGYGCLMRNLYDIGLAKTNGSVGEFGWDGWAGTYTTIDVKENMVIEMFISRVGYDNESLQRKVRSIVYGNI